MLAFLVGLPASDFVNSGTYIRCLNTNAPYQHEYIRPNHLMAVWRVQSLRYDYTFVSHFIALVTRL